MLRSMPDRMVGTSLLNSNTIEELEHDRGATVQAGIIVVLTAISAGIGGLFANEMSVVDAFIALIVGLLSWAVWASSTWLVGTTILRTPETQADWGQMARGTGFAQSPGVFNFLAFVPWIGGLIVLILFFWRMAAMVVAVRQCLDYTSTWRAFFVVLISFVPVIILNAVVYALVYGE